MVQVCSKCGVEKSLDTFHYRKDSKKHRNECKVCWKYIQAARRYGISFEQAVEYYKQPSCMCCGHVFSTMKERHLHHVNHIVKGIVCKDCNILLGQEKPEDLYRLQACLLFMQKPRKNLFDKVNQQGSRSHDERCGPSTTDTPDSLRTCKCCKRQLSLKHFYRQRYVSGKYGYYRACKSCYKILVKTYKYGLTFEQVSFLRSKPYCDCCKKPFDNSVIPYIHHIGNAVLGTVCRLCNLYLEQETDQIKYRLLSCVNWLKDDDTV